MASKQPVVGQWYRNIHGTASNAEWDIDRIFRGVDGLQYATLRSVSDRTRLKTLSLSVVADTTRFVLVETGTRAS
jgi:hypothetical protein